MSDPTRRQILIKRMNELESSGMGCQGCAGTCCTYEANSMLLTPLEAFELITYLKSSNQLTQDLKIKLESYKSKYRLDSRYPSQKSYLRKTYTCPFFNHQELGCPLPREVKPYGCLAFNSHHPELKAGEHCFSEITLLEQREIVHKDENELNVEVKNKFNILWDKSPIPNALLDFWDQVIGEDQQCD